MRGRSLVGYLSGDTDAVQHIDPWSIDLVQSAMLYHDTDNLPVYNLGEQTLRDTSHDKRRDFCIVRRIEIPASLSLGRYNLKITVHDKAGNAVAQPLAGVIDPVTGLTFPDLNALNSELDQTNLILPEPCQFIDKNLPQCSVIRPTSTKEGGAVATIKALATRNLCISAFLLVRLAGWLASAV